MSGKRYRYTGKERDEETGLYYHGARHYAAWLARWTSADPSGMTDGPNLYRYGRANPIAFSDPSGRDSESQTAASRYRQRMAQAKAEYQAATQAYSTTKQSLERAQELAWEKQRASARSPLGQGFTEGKNSPMLVADEAGFQLQELERVRLFSGGQKSTGFA